MILYHAGSLLGSIACERFLCLGEERPNTSMKSLQAEFSEPLKPGPRKLKHRLLTYADVDEESAVMSGGQRSVDYWMGDEPGPEKRVFMDCGAYSVHMRGAVISLDRYMAFVRSLPKDGVVYVALDVVGNPAATDANFAVMEREGLTPIPVYTAAAPLSKLEALCERFRHIALGGLKGREAGTGTWRREHLDKVFQVAHRYWPVKFHAFGITAQWVLERYPMFSADSSVVLVGGGMGRVVLFDDDGEGEWDGNIINAQTKEYALRTGRGMVVDGLGADGSAHMARKLASLEGMLALERHITNLWAKRGVTWD